MKKYISTIGVFIMLFIVASCGSEAEERYISEALRISFEECVLSESGFLTLEQYDIAIRHLEEAEILNIEYDILNNRPGFAFDTIADGVARYFHMGYPFYFVNNDIIREYDVMPFSETTTDSIRILVRLLEIQALVMIESREAYANTPAPRFHYHFDRNIYDWRQS